MVLYNLIGQTAMATKDTLKLMVLPKAGVPFGEWEFVWVTKDELKTYQQRGYKRARKVKERDYA